MNPVFLLTIFNFNKQGILPAFKQENLTFALQFTDYDTRTGHTSIQH